MSPWSALVATLQEAAAQAGPEEALDAGEVWEFFRDTALQIVRDNAYLLFLALWGLAKAMGTTVQTGTTGLFFSFGRATRVLEPGFVFKIPYFQRVKVLPTRARTLDLPDQKVTSRDGLVWFVDVNLVFRVVDVRKALIEVDDLDYGMEQMMALSVQEIVRATGRESLKSSGELDPLFEQAMQRRLEPWGVEVESAGFTSVRPSPKTLRFTQQVHNAEERLRMLERLRGEGLSHGASLAMLGTAPRFERRSLRASRREELSRRRRRILHAVHRAEVASEKRLGAPRRKEIQARVLSTRRGAWT